MFNISRKIVLKQESPKMNVISTVILSACKEWVLFSRGVLGKRSFIFFENFVLLHSRIYLRRTVVDSVTKERRCL